MKLDFAECVALYKRDETQECVRRLHEMLTQDPANPEASFLTAMIASRTALPVSVEALFQEFLTADYRTGDTYESLGLALRTAGLEEIAILAFQAASSRDKQSSIDPHPWGNRPFNGQEERIALFQQLMKVVEIKAAVETGTFRGATTLFLYESTKANIYSCELRDRYHQYALSKLANHEKIHLQKGDSRAFLRDLALDDSVPKENIFFYLDAHWNADLPLLDELLIIYENFSSPIIMIDDFEVAHRQEFDFDDYGDNAILSIDILTPILSESLWLFYPDWVSHTGSSANRGFVMLADGNSAERIKTLSPLLRAFQPLDALVAQMKRYRSMYRIASA